MESYFSDFWLLASHSQKDSETNQLHMSAHDRFNILKIVANVFDIKMSKCQNVPKQRDY